MRAGRWLRPSTWLWHLLRVSLRAEHFTVEVWQGFRYYLGRTCGATSPHPNIPAGIRCNQAPRHHGFRRHKSSNPMDDYTWPGHPAGSAREPR